MSYFKEALEQFFKNTTKIYLILANVVLVVFAIWFSNAGLLPFKNLGDFAFFAILALILGLYRPGWTFLFFIGTLALENINLAPRELGLALRPYQFFGLITIIALLIQAMSKRLAFALPKFRWYDGLLIIFALAGFLSSLGAVNKGLSFKQSVVALSFVALYFLTRVYVQSLEDAKRTLPFFLSSGLVVSIYAIWQNVRFLGGENSFEVMPGRPNGTFTEADWLGIYLVFLMGVMFTMIYYFNKKSDNKKSPVTSHQSPIQSAEKVNQMTDDRLLMTKNHAKQIIYYVFLALISVALILTVSRSAWLGAAFVVIIFLKFTLLEYYSEINFEKENRWGRILEILKMQNWGWKKTGLQLIYIIIALGIGLLAIMSIPLSKFQLASRAASAGGLQKITIACQNSKHFTSLPQEISSVEELARYNCKHINLEDIEKERDAGNIIAEVSRPDPNVTIRSEIYKKSIVQIKSHPIFGLGWGGISLLLGSDERGAGLNASNILLEVWLGSGVLGFVSLVALLGYILVASIRAFWNNKKNNTAIAFVMLGWAAIFIPNLFNSGIFLGFVWVYLAVAIGLLAERK